jgi:hypothetical protein
MFTISGSKEEKFLCLDMLVLLKLQEKSVTFNQVTKLAKRKKTSSL